MLDLVRKTASRNVPTRDHIVGLVERHEGGIGSRKLMDVLISEDYGISEIQYAVRQALDSGDLRLGQELKLFVNK